LNIYLDPLENVRPIATIRTSDIDGTITWFSGDPEQNPTLRGVETTGGKTEGFRILRVAFEPDVNVPGGCDKDSSNSLNGSAMELTVLVRSRVDLQVKQTWSNSGVNGIDTGEMVQGEVALLRDRIDMAIENEEIIFAYEYFDDSTNQWILSNTNNRTRTDEQGTASFAWEFTGKSCDGNECIGLWRITAYYPGSTYFAPSQDNITHEIHWRQSDDVSSQSSFFSPQNIVLLSIILMALLIAGLMYYQRVQERRQVQALHGILTDAIIELRASNEYIAIIFDCYKNLVKHFKKYGFMKKVYETAREFEAAVRTAFGMVPEDQMDAFLSIFEEARYSEHTIDATHRDKAVGTLSMITTSLTRALVKKAKSRDSTLPVCMKNKPRQENLLQQMEQHDSLVNKTVKAQISQSKPCREPMRFDCESLCRTFKELDPCPPVMDDWKSMVGAAMELETQDVVQAYNKYQEASRHALAEAQSLLGDLEAAQIIEAIYGAVFSYSNSILLQMKVEDMAPGEVDHTFRVGHAYGVSCVLNHLIDELKEFGGITSLEALDDFSDQVHDEILKEANKSDLAVEILDAKGEPYYPE